ncbi:hypothetical protein ACFSKI_00450 [Pseudogracilibacillus auburnensis]|uniref:hypothetical protein n=1 Tax=Pseudogracilibacillus auburnensis TaxID=1494959 RepID=UPI001FD3F0E1|nr:hypothetical protein [Pseudogracilibacillus auburnensis]
MARLRVNVFLALLKLIVCPTFNFLGSTFELEAEADLLYISKRLGHGSIQTTADTYLDITPQYECNELSKVTNHLNSDVARIRHDNDLTK